MGERVLHLLDASNMLEFDQDLVQSAMSASGSASLALVAETSSESR
jgi:hypothetical protein